MSEVDGIQEGGGINPINPKNKGRQDYSSLRQYKEKKSFKIRIGEIVKGSITSDPIESEAYVELPVGTLLAQLHSKLKKGDSLFFKVHEVEPSLELRVHGISGVSQGKELITDEILRILDIPDTKLFRDIIDFLKTTRSIIYRDEALILDRSYSSLDKTIINSYHEADIFKGLIFIEESKLPLNMNLLNKILPAFIGTRKIDLLIKQFENEIQTIYLAEFNIFKEIFTLLRTGNFTTRDGLEFFSVEPIVKNKLSYFFNSLLEFLQNPKFKSLGIEYSTLKTLARQILEYIEGHFIINTLSYEYDTPLYFLLPYYYERNYHLIQIILKKPAENKPADKRFYRLSIITNTENLGEISTTCDFFGQNINIEFVLKDDNIKNIMNTHISKLKDTFNQHNTIIQNINLKSLSDPTNTTSSGGIHPQLQGISVVV